MHCYNAAMKRPSQLSMGTPFAINFSACIATLTYKNMDEIAFGFTVCSILITVWVVAVYKVSTRP